MQAVRIVITAQSLQWAHHAAASLCGFATSVIACGVEAGLERELGPDETPDGRPGCAVLLFAMSVQGLAKQLSVRVGQTVMTCATAACYADPADPADSADPADPADPAEPDGAGARAGQGAWGRAGQDARALPLGSHLRYFGDGYQIAKVLDGRRYWRIPVMHGEFLCEDRACARPAVGGGNFLVFAEDVSRGLRACEAAVAAMAPLAGVITPFPGGVVGSGSRVGSRYSGLKASTNAAYCPTLKAQVDTALGPEEGAVLEIVIDGLAPEAVSAAMQAGIRAACQGGRASGVCRIGAANYGGALGAHHFPLREVLTGAPAPP